MWCVNIEDAIKTGIKEDKLIKSKDLIRAVGNYILENKSNMFTVFGLLPVFNIINSQPAVEIPNEHKKSHWEFKCSEKGSILEVNAQCPECGFSSEPILSILDIPTLKGDKLSKDDYLAIAKRRNKLNFCPNCGADMREGVK